MCLTNPAEPLLGSALIVYSLFLLHLGNGFRTSCLSGLCAGSPRILPFALVSVSLSSGGPAAGTFVLEPALVTESARPLLGPREAHPISFATTLAFAASLTFASALRLPLVKRPQVVLVQGRLVVIPGV